MLATLLKMGIPVAKTCSMQVWHSYQTHLSAIPKVSSLLDSQSEQELLRFALLQKALCPLYMLLLPILELLFAGIYAVNAALPQFLQQKVYCQLVHDFALLHF